MLLILCGVSSGLYDFTLKLFTTYSASSKSMLNLLTYLVSALILGGMVLLPQKGEKVAIPWKKIVLPILLMSVCLFLNSYFKAFSTQYLPDAALYPIYQAGGLILSTVIGAVFFKERVTVRCVIGLALAFAAILLLK